MPIWHILQGVLKIALTFFPMELGKNIRKHRKSKGLTQTELAEILGTAQYVITNYERGLRKPPADKIPQIAKALGVPLEDLYGINSKDAMPLERKGAGTRREAEIQKIFRELPPTKQRAVLEHAKGLLKGK